MSEDRSFQATTQLPFNLEAEQSVLGAMLLDEEVKFLVQDLLRPEDFYSRRHSVIYQAILSLADPADTVTVTNALNAAGEWDNVGGNTYLAELMNVVPSTANTEAYARIVLRDSKRRSLIRKLQRTAAQAAVDPDYDAVRAAHDSSLIELDTRDKTDSMSTALDLAFGAHEHIERVREGGIPKGIRFGLPSVDHLVAGLHPGDLAVLAAPPSVGKTAFALQVMARSGEECVAFSLEQEELKWSLRLWANLGSIRLQALLYGGLTNEELAALPAVKAVAEGLPIRVDDTPGLTCDEVCNRARRAYRAKPFKWLVIDHLQQFLGTEPGPKDYEVVSNSVRKIKRLAKELSVSTLLLAQMSRDVGKRPNKRPLLSDLRDSGVIEQVSDQVIFLYRPYVYDKDADPRECEVIVGKNRDGQIGSVQVTWFGQYQRFAEGTPPRPGFPGG